MIVIGLKELRAQLDASVITSGGGLKRALLDPGCYYIRCSIGLKSKASGALLQRYLYNVRGFVCVSDKGDADELRPRQAAGLFRVSAQRGSVALYSLLERRFVAIDELTGENKHIANFAARNANFEVCFNFVNSIFFEAGTQHCFKQFS